MNNITLKQFAEQSSIPAALVRGVVRQIGGWDEFKGRARDVANHGAAGGFVGFTWHSDTVAFTRKHKADILTLCETQADDFDIKGGFLEFIAGFNCLQGWNTREVGEGIYNPRSDARTTVYNALAWYALEEVARAYCDILENQE